MQTQKVNSTSTVVEIPTLQAIAEKSSEVDRLREQLMSNLSTENREYFRNLWGKARAELSQMQTLYHFTEKGVIYE